jgi:flagellar protein FliO/FliZ
MSAAWVSLTLVVLVLALIPVALKWLQRSMGVSVGGVTSSSKVISVIAIGPHQRVVTVEVGPQAARVWLTLGVTAQNISCLHTSNAPDSPAVVISEASGSSLASKS